MNTFRQVCRISLTALSLSVAALAQLNEPSFTIQFPQPVTQFHEWGFDLATLGSSCKVWPSLSASSSRKFLITSFSGKYIRILSRHTGGVIDRIDCPIGTKLFQ